MEYSRMRTLWKRSFQQGRAWLLAAALLAAMGRPAAAQVLITNYNEFLPALKNNSVINGFLVITNFQTNAYISLEGDQQIRINRNVLIDGTTNGVVFDGSSLVRLFTVATNCVLMLNNLQVLNGLSTNGGAIYNEGTLIISNCIISGNSATNVTGTNGATNLSNGNGGSGVSGGSAQGGAIYSRGPVSIYYSVLGSNNCIAGSGGSGGSGGDGVLFGGDGGNAGGGGSACGAAVYSAGSPNIFVSTEFFNNTCTAGSAGSGGSTGAGVWAGVGGQGAAGGSAAGGAVYTTKPAYVTNCVFAYNTVKGGAAGADLSGNNSGYGGGSAEGGGLYLLNTVTNAYIENSVFFDNACTGGAGGSATSGQAGGNGSAVGGGLASAAALATVRNCTLASNTLATSTTGTNSAIHGWEIGRTAGVLRLSGSILSGGTNVTPNSMPNAYGITDAGYNISSDWSLTRTSTSTLTNSISVMLDTLVSGFGNVSVGPTNVSGPPFETVDIAAGSVAAGFIPGVPGLSFPATDQLGNPRGTPTSAGAYELNAITLDAAATTPIVSGNAETNFTDDGSTVTFSVSATSDDPTNALGYQWQLNGTNLPDNKTFIGSTSPSLTVAKVTGADEGAYQVVVGVSLLESAATNTGFSIIITNPVKITTQPASKTEAPVGSVAIFSVGMSGSPPFTFQWYMGTDELSDGTNAGGSEISGSASSNLTINPALASDAGKYFVVVANDYATRTSAVVTLSINPQDKIKPTVAFSSPAAGARTNNPAITGTAADNAQVTNVVYWVTNVNDGQILTNSGAASLSTNGTTAKNGTTTMTWSITNALLPGTNHVTVQSVDYSGNKSPLVTREFFYRVTAPFHLQINPLGTNAGTVKGAAPIKGEAGPSNEAALYIGESYTLTAKPAPHWELANWTENTNIASTKTTFTFIMESNLVVTANFTTNLASSGEKTKPSVAITSPKANTRTNAPVLSGTASDHVAVLNVAYWITNLNHGVRTTTSGLAALTKGTGSVSNWSIPIQSVLLPGTNILTVRSSNNAGLASTAASSAFFYQVASPFHLQITPPMGTGAGAITGEASVKGGPAPSNDAALYVGEGYKLTAKPAKSWLLATWMTNAGIAGTNTTLFFIMESNLVVTANFDSNLLAGADARYDGIFYPSDSQASATNSGLIGNLVLKSNGIYSGKLYLEGTAYSLAGAFSRSGYTTETIDRIGSAGGNVTLAMNILPQSQVRQIAGSVQGANWSASNLNLYAATTNLRPASNYTLLLPRDTNVADAPPGDGYALITNMAGMMRMGGALSDGTWFSALLEPVNEQDQFPVYASLTNKGLLLGQLSLDASAVAAVPAGGLIWFKPALPKALYSNEFTAILDVEGSPWTNSAAALAGLFVTNTQLTFSGGGLASNVECTLRWITSNTFGATPDFAGGSINRADGLMTLAFTNAGGQKVTAFGAVLQNTNLGGGFFLNGGSISLTPDTPANP